MEGPRSCSTCGTLLPPRSGNGDPRPRCRKCIKASEPDRLGWTTPHCCASCHRWLLPEKFSRTQQRLGKRARCMTCALEHTQLRRGVSVAQMQIDQIQQQQQQQIQVLQTQQHVQPQQQQQQQQQQQPLLGDSLSRVPPEGPLDLTLPFTMLNVKSPQPTQQQHKQEHSQLGHHFGSTPLPIPIPPVQAPAASMLAGDILSLLLGTHPNTNNTNNTTTYTKSQSWIGPAGPKPHPIHNVHPGYQLQHQHHPQQQDSLTRSPRSEPSPIISAPHLAHPGKFPPSLPPPPMMGLAELLNAPGPLTVPTTTASQAATTTSQLFRADTTDTHESAFTTSAMVLCRGPCGRLCVASDTIGQPFPEPWCSSCVGALLALLKANN